MSSMNRWLGISKDFQHGRKTASPTAPALPIPEELKEPIEVRPTTNDATVIVRGEMTEQAKEFLLSAEEHTAWCERLRMLVESQPMTEGDTISKMLQEARY